MSNKSKYENQSVSPIQKLSGPILKYTQGVPSTDTDNLNYYKNFIQLRIENSDAILYNVVCSDNDNNIWEARDESSY